MTTIAGCAAKPHAKICVHASGTTMTLDVINLLDKLCLKLELWALEPFQAHILPALFHWTSKPRPVWRWRPYWIQLTKGQTDQKKKKNNGCMERAGTSRYFSLVTRLFKGSAAERRRLGCSAGEEKQNWGGWQKGWIMVHNERQQTHKRARGALWEKKLNKIKSAAQALYPGCSHMFYIAPLLLCPILLPFSPGEYAQLA